MEEAVQQCILNCFADEVRLEDDDGSGKEVIYMQRHIARTKHPLYYREGFTFDKKVDENSTYFKISDRKHSCLTSTWIFHQDENGVINIIARTTHEQSVLFTAIRGYKEAISSLVIILQLKFFWLALSDEY